MSEDQQSHDPKSHIVRRAEMYFGAYPVRLDSLLAYLLEDMDDAGAVRFDLSRDGGRVLVWSETDWMADASETVASLFERFHVKRGDTSRPNRFRSEVLIAAMSRRVFTEGPAGAFSHEAGRGDAWPVVNGGQREGRALFFEVDEQHLARRAGK